MFLKFGDGFNFITFYDNYVEIEPEEAPEKNKDLNQDIAEETTNEFNEGDLSEDGVSDEDFEKNEKIVSVDEPMSLEELESKMKKIYEEHKSEDGFLYIEYDFENVFG